MGQLIEQHIFGTAHLEQIFKEIILDRLGEYRACLKSFEINAWMPTTVQESIMMKRDFPQGIFVVKGYLALDDSGVGVRYFEINVEQGLPKDKDEQIAKDLAHHCFVCVCKMKRERKKNPDAAKLIVNG